jgi:hypothetical protein
VAKDKTVPVQLGVTLLALAAAIAELFPVVVIVAAPLGYELLRRGRLGSVVLLIASLAAGAFATLVLIFLSAAWG